MTTQINIRLLFKESLQAWLANLPVIFMLASVSTVWQSWFFTDPEGLFVHGVDWYTLSILVIGGVLLEALYSPILHRVTLTWVSQNQHSTLDSVAYCLRHYMSFVLLYLTLTVVVTFGLILLIVPGVIWGLKYSLISPIRVTKQLSIGETLRESARLTAGYRPLLFMLILSYCLPTFIIDWLFNDISEVVALALNDLVRSFGSVMFALFYVKRLQIDRSVST